MNTYMTASGRRNDWSPIQELKVEMDRLFGATSWQPACELSEDQDHYLLSVEMAGIPKEQIKIEVIDHQLMISGDRKLENRKKEPGYSYSERKYGKFQRNFTLPIGLDTDKIEAHCQDGVLRVLIPKSEAAKPRQIKIGGESGTGFFGNLIGQVAGKERTGEQASREPLNGKAVS